MEIAKIDYWSFLKGIAILIIITIHTSQSFELSPIVKLIPTLGDQGCQIFFFITGYLLCLSSYRRSDDYKTYMKRRYFRVAPGFWLTMVVAIVISFLSIILTGANYTDTSLNPIAWIPSALLLHGLLPYMSDYVVVRGGWYIGTLIILYALFPLIKNVYERYKSNGNALFVLPLIVFIANLIIWNTLDIIDIHPKLHFEANYCYYFSFLNQLPCFMLGMNYYYDQKGRREVKYIHPKLLVLLVIDLYIKWQGVINGGEYVPYVMGMIVYYVVTLISQKGVKNTRLNSLICNFGNRSYGIYLIHFYIVGEIVSIIKQSIPFDDNINFILLLPFAMCLSYYVGCYYDKLIVKINKIFQR